MDVNSHFLSKDLDGAYTELLCMSSCMHSAAICIKNEDYSDAVVHLENALRSVRELERLNNKKKNRKNLEKLASELSAKGVKIMVLKRKI